VFFLNSRTRVEEIEMIKAINGLLDQKVPYVRRNYTKTTKIRTVARARTM
jgi:hypothetical protein